MPSSSLIARGYHGTTLAAATAIKQTKNFIAENRSWHWLGQGVYFWQDAPLRAWDWAEERAKEEKRKGNDSAVPAVVSATIKLGACLDLLDIEHWGLLQRVWQQVEEQYKDQSRATGDPMPTQVGPAEVFSDGVFKRYGNNRCDYDVMNLAVQLLEDGGAAVSTARGAFMEGSDLFKGSWLLSRSHVQIAVVDPEQIKAVIEDIEIEDGAVLQHKHDKLVKTFSAGWSRMMKPSA